MFHIREDQTLLSALQKAFPDASKNSLKQWVTHGRVEVDGKLVQKTNAQVYKDQRLDLKSKKQLIDKGIQILFEDEHLVVLNKPQGLLSVAADIEGELSVHRILKERRKGQRVFPVHRLDKETSGVMMFAYSEPCRFAFKELFFHHTIQREYIAVIEGYLEESEGTWESYLREDDEGLVHVVDSPEKAKRAVTHFKVLKAGLRTSQLSLTLETGRKNQIRAQAQEAKHPIVGDKKYGSSYNPYKRMMLHAKILGFDHPMTKKPLYFEVRPEPCFEKML